MLLSSSSATMLHVVADRVHPVRGADRAAVAVAHHDEHGEVGAVQLDARRDRQRAPVNAVEAVGLEVVREAARAADAGDEHRLLRLELLGDEQLLHGGEHRVVAAAGTPARRSVLRSRRARSRGRRPSPTVHAPERRSRWDLAHDACLARALELIIDRMALEDRAGPQRLAGHARPAVDVDERLRAQQPRELAAPPILVGDERIVGVVAVVDLDRRDLLEAREDLAQPGLERREEREMQSTRPACPSARARSTASSIAPFVLPQPTTSRSPPSASPWIAGGVSIC